MKKGPNLDLMLNANTSLSTESPLPYIRLNYAPPLPSAAAAAAAAAGESFLAAMKIKFNCDARSAMLACSPAMAMQLPPSRDGTERGRPLSIGIAEGYQREMSLACLYRSTNDGC